MLPQREFTVNTGAQEENPEATRTALIAFEPVAGDF